MTAASATHLGRMFLLGGIVILIFDTGYVALKVVGMLSFALALGLMTWGHWREMGGDE